MRKRRVENSLHVSYVGNRARRGTFLFCFVGNIMNLVLTLDLRYLKDI